MAKESIRRRKASSKTASSFKKQVSIETELCGFKLHSPTMLASGVLGISFNLFPRIIKSGAGAVVSKSIGLEPREGYSNPTMTGADSGYLNAIGLANPGSDEFEKELDQEFMSDYPLIVSIFADSAENFAKLAAKLESHNFTAFELNLSCPHVAEVGSEIGSNPKDAAGVVKAVRSVTKKPILAKMPAIIINVPEWSLSVQDAGADAIVAINTIRAMRIDVESRKPILSNKIGGLSGPAIRPVGVRCVYELFRSVSIPIIGVGGVSDWKDAVEYFLAGAKAVQIGSAMGHPNYLSTFGEINAGIQTYLMGNGFTKLGDIVGLAHK